MAVEKKPKSSTNEEAKAREKQLYYKENIMSIVGEIRAIAFAPQLIQIQLMDFQSFIADPRTRFNVPKDPKELRDITSFLDSMSNGYQFGYKFSRYVYGKCFNLYLCSNNINSTGQIQEFCLSNGYSPLHVLRSLRFARFIQFHPRYDVFYFHFHFLLNFDFFKFKSIIFYYLF